MHHKKYTNIKKLCISLLVRLVYDVCYIYLVPGTSLPLQRKTICPGTSSYNSSNAFIVCLQ